MSWVTHGFPNKSIAGSRGQPTGLQCGAEPAGTQCEAGTQVNLQSCEQNDEGPLLYATEYRGGLLHSRS